MNAETATIASAVRTACRSASRPVCRCQARERLGIAEHGQVVHRDDDRRTRAQRHPHRRAVEHVEIARRPARSRPGTRRRRARSSRPGRGRRTTAGAARARAVPRARASSPRTMRAVPAPVCTSGEVSMPTLTSAPLDERVEHRLARRAPREPRGVLDPRRHELVAARERLLDPRRDRRRDRSGSTRTAARSARLVERRMVRGDDGRSARHRLDDRDPEALEQRGVDDDGGPAIERGQLLRRRRIRAGRCPGSSSPGCSPQPAPPASTSRCSPPSSRQASTRRWRFLRGSSVPTPRTYGPPKSAARPRGGTRPRRPGARRRAARPRSRGSPSHRPRCSAELVKITSQARTASASLRRCIATVRGVHHSG